MKLTPFTHTQYLQTMAGGMNALPKNYESSVDIWDYASLLLQENLISQYGVQHKLIEDAYKNQENTYHHILLFTNQKNLYVVIIVDVPNQTIAGHYLLDLNKLYF